jgi:hypothetical protein
MTVTSVIREATKSSVVAVNSGVPQKKSTLPATTPPSQNSPDPREVQQHYSSGQFSELAIALGAISALLTVGILGIVYRKIRRNRFNSIKITSIN